MMTGGQGKGTSDGLQFERECETVGQVTLKHGWIKVTMSATVYVIGIVDIDEQWLRSLIPDGKQLEHFMKGREREFHAHNET